MIQRDIKALLDMRVTILYCGQSYPLDIPYESRLSELAAQFHLNCCNIEGEMTTFWYQGKQIKKLSQSVAEAVKNNHQPIIELRTSKRLTKCSGLNCQFYQNQYRPPELGMTIDELLDCRGRYDFLESSTQYFPWLFPTSFKSTFNDLTHILTEEEASEFRRNGIIGKRIYKAYSMFMDFLGIQVANTAGDLNISSLERMQFALITRVHNHLRVRRMLSCLSVVGFRRIALKFLSFIEKVIKCYFKDKLQMIFMSSWNKYSNKTMTNALKNCGITDPQIFEIENPYVHDLIETPYAFWKGYPSAVFGVSMQELLAGQKPNLLLSMLEILFPSNPRDVEDIKTINGYENIIEELLKLLRLQLDTKPSNTISILETTKNSLLQLGLEKKWKAFNS